MTKHDPDYMTEIFFAEDFGIKIFEPEETFTFRGMNGLIAQDPRKKVILKHWRDWTQVPVEPEDLSWADLMVLYTTDAVSGPWDSLCQQVQQHLNCENFVFIGEGVFNMPEYDHSRVYIDHQHHANKIVAYCKFKPWNLSADKPKLFDALIGSTDRELKPHRCFVFDQLQKHNLLDRCFVNSWGSINYRSAELETTDDSAIKDFKNSTTYLAQLQNGISMSFSIPIDIYQQSWYSIVTETLGYRSNHITEKIMKPMFEKRIFVVFGAQGTLSRLHDLGYKTFDPWIDESYDQEPNDSVRWQMAFDQVLKLSQADHATIYQQLDLVLEHNHTWMKDKFESRIQNLKSFLDSHIAKL